MTKLERASTPASPPQATVSAAEQSAAATDTYTQDAWSILYGALVKAFGVSPSTFQMAYPYSAWTWPTQNSGYIGPAQYDTLSTIPAWSAIGKYVSTGRRFHEQYHAFLQVISPDTTDPELRRRLDDLQDQLTEATNAYDRTVQQAQDAYEADGSTDKASFTQWLAGLTGKSWQTRITSLDRAMQQASANYNAAVDEAETPNLARALKAYDDKDFWAQLNDPNLAKMPKVPNWSTATTAQKWKDRAATKDVPGGSLTFTNGDSSFDFSKTWAGGSTSVGNWFWQVKVGARWTRIDTFESDSKLSATIEFEGIEEVGVQPSDWYAGVGSLAKGPFKRGYSAKGTEGTQAVFGENGFLPMVKTGMYVAYRPSFTITVDTSTFSAFKETFQAATGIRIGPFSFSADGGSEKSGWTAKESGLSFSGQTDSTDPFILGYTLAVLP